MAFNLESWRSDVRAWWVDHASDLKTSSIDSAYAMLASSAWLPLITAYSQDPGAATTALVSITAGIGSNLVANVVQNTYDRTHGGQKVTEQAQEQTQIRAELDAVIQSTRALEAAQETLGERWIEFEAQLTDELERLGCELHVETNGGAVISGGVKVQYGEFVGRDKIEQYIITSPLELSPDLETLRTDYLKYLIAAHRFLDFKGIPQVNRVANRILLEDVFVPLLVRPTVPDADTWRRQRFAVSGTYETGDELEMSPEGMTAPAEVTVRQPIDEVIRKETVIILLGGPGTGKSTLLKHLALRSADENDPLPILLSLGAYAEELQRGEVSLQTFLARYYSRRRRSLKNVGALFETALSEGKAMVLLDGLDEVATDQRRYAYWEIEEFVRRHREQGSNRFIVTSRIVGYQDYALAGATWPTYTLARWTRREIEQSAYRWNLALQIATHGHSPEARAAADREQRGLLETITPDSDLERLASNPLLLTIMVLIGHHRRTLPRELVKLYNLYLEVLISVWNKVRTLHGFPLKREVHYLDTVQVLAPLALWLQETNPASGLVNRDRMRNWLIQFYKREWSEPHGTACEHARRFLQDVHDCSNVLVEREEGRYGFLHLTFQEMLAAKGIADLMDKEGLDAAMEVFHRHWMDPVWHKTLMLTVGVLGIIKENRYEAGRMLQALCKRDLKGGARGRNAILAGEALASVGETGADPGSREVVLSQLVQVMQDGKTSALTRRAAGHLLGQLGWEPAGGLDTWVEIPPGPFPYGDSKKRRKLKHCYRIGQYPVTNKQFARFVEAGGYEERACWSEEGWNWRNGTSDRRAHDFFDDSLIRRPPEKRDRPFAWNNEQLASPLCPVVGVSWFEAEAYCRWLALEMGLEPDGANAPRLPTELEWERAVRGNDGREFPWGSDWDRTQLNCAEWWKGEELSDSEDLLGWLHSKEFRQTQPSPTTVMTFPRGRNESGIWDGAGNVWEWTKSWSEERWCKEEELEEGICMRRELRGGSWDKARSYCLCTYAFGHGPGGFFDTVGFRVVIPGHWPSET